MLSEGAPMGMKKKKKNSHVLDKNDAKPSTIQSIIQSINYFIKRALFINTLECELLATFQ